RVAGDPSRTVPLQRAPRRPRTPAVVPRLPSPTRFIPGPRVAHGENHATGRTRPRPVPEARRKSRRRHRPVARRGRRSRLGDAEDPAHGPAPHRILARLPRGEPPPRGARPRSLAPRHRIPDISRSLSADAAEV